MTRLGLATVLVSCLCIHSEASETPPPVTLEEVLSIARANAPAIAAAGARVRRAEGLARTPTVLPDPAVAVGVGRGRPAGGGASGSESSFEIVQSLPAPWGHPARNRTGAAGIELARREEAETITAVLFEAKTLYYEAVLGEARARALRESSADARSLLEVVRRRVEVGEAPGVDLLRARVEALRAESEAESAAAEAEGARGALVRFLLGALPADRELPADLDPADLPAIPVAVEDDVIARNPSVAAAEARLEWARSRLSSEKQARLPGLELTYRESREIDKKAWEGALGFTVPLWNRNQGPVLVAQAELAEAEADVRDARARNGSALERAIRVESAARRIAITYRTEILPASSEALATARSSLEQGEASLLVWLEARRSHLEVLRASYDARLEGFLTRADLERLMGENDVVESR